MMGHSPIGAAIRASGLFAAAHRPFMLQNVGGAITRCMVRGTTLDSLQAEATVRKQACSARLASALSRLSRLQRSRSRHARCPCLDERSSGSLAPRRLAVA